MQHAKVSGLVLPIALDLKDRVLRAYSVYGRLVTFFYRPGGRPSRPRDRGPLTAERDPHTP
jgi:hypothetical protein